MKASVEVSHWNFKCDIESIAICGNCGNEVKISEVTPHCPICGARMVNYVDAPCEYFHIENGEQVCWEVKKKEYCNCGGDKRLCNFQEY